MRCTHWNFDVWAGSVYVNNLALKSQTNLLHVLCLEFCIKLKGKK